ncbi:hypothetical protein ACP70R_011503 [Stipagrostis hirtigluma subsp. patula]
MVIRVSMPCDKSRSKAMALAARADGVISMGITGDARDRLEVVGDGVDPVCLVSCLRRKLGHAEILQVEEVKDKKPEEKKKPEEPTPKPVVVPPPPQCYPGYYYHHHYPPPPMVVCDEPSNCPIM